MRSGISRTLSRATISRASTGPAGRPDQVDQPIRPGAQQACLATIRAVHAHSAVAGDVAKDRVTHGRVTAVLSKGARLEDLTVFELDANLGQGCAHGRALAPIGWADVGPGLLQAIGGTGEAAQPSGASHGSRVSGGAARRRGQLRCGGRWASGANRGATCIGVDGAFARRSAGAGARGGRRASCRPSAPDFGGVAAASCSTTAFVDPGPWSPSCGATTRTARAVLTVRPRGRGSIGEGALLALGARNSPASAGTITHETPAAHAGRERPASAGTTCTKPA